MPEVDKAQRLFVGVPIAAATRERLVRALPSNLPGKLSPPDNWHFTLRFLGPTAAEQRDRLTAALNATDFGRQFEIHFDKLGAFPNARKARVVWLGVGKGAEALKGVAELVEAAAVKSGFDPERRGFSPHLTLSRLRDPQPVAHLLAAGK
jgi:2'-5' RNA ligase